MVATFIAMLMGAEADAVCGAGYGEVSPERVNSRNGYRHRDSTPGSARWTSGSPSCAPAAISRNWLVTPRRRAEQR
jgi:putative transposase